MGTARPRPNQNPTITKGPTMKHEWHQPLRRLEYRYLVEPGEPPAPWQLVLFVRALDNGYEIMGLNGNVWRDRDVYLRVGPV
jgi:hypothetical protein